MAVACDLQIEAGAIGLHAGLLDLYHLQVPSGGPPDAPSLPRNLTHDATQILHAFTHVLRRTKWSSTLKTYAEPVIGSLSVYSIDTALVMKTIEPLWSKKPETASRLRGRIGAMLDWTTVRGFRQGENPARRRGHLDKLLPARAKVRKVKQGAQGQAPRRLAL
ncbi:hypothetical protein ACVIJ6_001780 [Bradyrhizobium sp. USDA 4369]